MAKGDSLGLEELEAQMAQIQQRLGRREGSGGGWFRLFTGLGIGALVGGGIAYLLRSREEEPLYSPPPAPAAPARREDDAVVLSNRPAPVAAPAAPQAEDAPIVLPQASAAPPPAAQATEGDETSGWVAPSTTDGTAPAPQRAPMPAASAAQEAAASPAAPTLAAADDAGDEIDAAAEAPAPISYPNSVAPTDNLCPPSHPIKGNVNRQGELIFHVPGSNNYERTYPEACFASEAEAEEAGFRKARS